MAEGHQLSEEFERSHFAGLSEKTVRGHRSYLNNLKTFFANCTLDKVTVEIVETYRSADSYERGASCVGERHGDTGPCGRLGVE